MKYNIQILEFVAVMFIVAMFIASPVQANPLKGQAGGVWDFEADMIVRLENNKYRLEVVLFNRSTDTSYRCDGCSAGCASVLIDYELWNPDAGMVWSDQLSFKDICNGEISTKAEILKELEPKYGKLETRWNVTTPNGGHSFHKSHRTHMFR